MPSTTFYNLPAEKRERLLSAARAEFARVPYEDASVNRGSSWTPTAGICSPRFWPCMTSFRTTGSGGPSRSWGPSCAATGR